MSFRTERQRSEESLLPCKKEQDLLVGESPTLEEKTGFFPGEIRLFMYGLRDSSLRWRSVRNDM